MKPQNVLLNKSKDALVADLGTVRLVATKNRTDSVGEDQRHYLLNEKLKLFERSCDPEKGGVDVNQTHNSVNATGVTAMLGTPGKRLYFLLFVGRVLWGDDIVFAHIIC